MDKRRCPRVHAHNSETYCTRIHGLKTERANTIPWKCCPLDVRRKQHGKVQRSVRQQATAEHATCDVLKHIQHDTNVTRDCSVRPLVAGHPLLQRDTPKSLLLLNLIAVSRKGRCVLQRQVQLPQSRRVRWPIQGANRYISFLCRKRYLLFRTNQLCTVLHILSVVEDIPFGTSLL
jgi:hypothetical protein